MGSMVSNNGGGKVWILIQLGSVSYEVRGGPIGGHADVVMNGKYNSFSLFFFPPS